MANANTRYRKRQRKRRGKKGLPARPPTQWRRKAKVKLAKRDGRCCFWCRERFDDLRGVSIDHLMPQADFGRNAMSNLVLSCVECNGKRKAKQAPTAVLYEIAFRQWEFQQSANTEGE